MTSLSDGKELKELVLPYARWGADRWREQPKEIRKQAEPVNDFETLTIAIYCAISPVVDVTGGLIQTASGRASGFGMPRTKRSGCWVQAA